MVPRWRVGGWPTHGSALASSGSLRRNDGITLGDRLPRHGADRHGVGVVANEGEVGNAGDVDEPRRPRQPHRQHGDQRLPAGDDARAVIRGQQPAGLADAAGPHVVESNRLHIGLPERPPAHDVAVTMASGRLLHQ